MESVNSEHLLRHSRKSFGFAAVGFAHLHVQISNCRHGRSSVESKCKQNIREYCAELFQCLYSTWIQCVHSCRDHPGSSCLKDPLEKDHAILD